jgi:hypothetical protein
VTVEQKSGEIRGLKAPPLSIFAGHSTRFARYTQEEIVSRDFILDGKPAALSHRGCDEYRAEPHT